MILGCWENDHVGTGFAWQGVRPQRPRRRAPMTPILAATASIVTLTFGLTTVMGESGYRFDLRRRNRRRGRDGRTGGRRASDI